jgi:hypothetical protein
LIKSLSPTFNPANIISVRYDLNNDFVFNYGIYSALIGIENQSELIDKVNEIQFVEPLTDKVLHSHKITA